jgi:hypothetical protein
MLRVLTTTSVIPGRAEGAGPESILRSAEDYGFRARRFAAPRNDGQLVGDV